MGHGGEVEGRERDKPPYLGKWRGENGFPYLHYSATQSPLGKGANESEDFGKHCHCSRSCRPVIFKLESVSATRWRQTEIRTRLDLGLETGPQLQMASLY